GRDPLSSDLDLELCSLFRHGRWQIRRSDRRAERRAYGPAHDLATLLAVEEDRVSMPGIILFRQREADELLWNRPRLLPLQRSLAHKLALLQLHQPGEVALER